jgi:deoxyribonuclease-4
MFVGAHVSTGGGLANAVQRGKERGCESIQIFHQSPRMWRPTNHTEEDFAAFREAMEASPVEAVIIHAVYLINCATKDKELRKKSLTSRIKVPFIELSASGRFSVSQVRWP